MWAGDRVSGRIHPNRVGTHVRKRPGVKSSTRRAPVRAGERSHPHRRRGQVTRANVTSIVAAISCSPDSIGVSPPPELPSPVWLRPDGGPPTRRRGRRDAAVRRRDRSGPDIPAGLPCAPFPVPAAGGPNPGLTSAVAAARQFWPAHRAQSGLHRCRHACDADLTRRRARSRYQRRTVGTSAELSAQTRIGPAHATPSRITPMRRRTDSNPAGSPITPTGRYVSGETSEAPKRPPRFSASVTVSLR
jgi:hypothetical protein